MNHWEKKYILVTGLNCLVDEEFELCNFLGANFMEYFWFSVQQKSCGNMM